MSINQSFDYVFKEFYGRQKKSYIQIKTPLINANKAIENQSHKYFKLAPRNDERPHHRLRSTIFGIYLSLRHESPRNGH